MGLEDKVSKIESGFSPKIMQNHSRAGSLEEQDRKVRFPKLILHRGLEAFVDIRLIFFFKDQDLKTESRF